MTAAIVVLALLVVATAAGLAWRATTGRARRTASGAAVDDSAFAGLLGDRATLLQFSSEHCAPCRATSRLLAGLAVDGVRHLEVDVAERPDLAARHHVLQTPTTLVLDPDGRVRARIGGAPRTDVLRTELAAVLA